MRILDRYLLNNFLHALLYCLFLFAMLFVVIDVFNNLDEFLKSSVSPKIIGLYYLYSLPSILVQIVPVAVLVSILAVLGSLNRHNEILALKASGISAFHIVAPYLFIGAVLSFGVFLVSEKIVPRTSVMTASIMEGLIEKGKRLFEERAIRNVTLVTSDNHMVFAREFELMSETLHDVVLFENEANRIIQTKTAAKRAVYEDGIWRFYESIRYRMNRRGEIEGEPQFSETLRVNLDATPEDFLKESSQLEFMNTRQLREYIENMKGVSQKLVQKLLVDFHYKIAFPFVSFVVILIGAPLALRSVRGGAIKGIGISVGVVLLYYGLDSVCLALGRGGHLPPALSAWSSNLLFTALGIYMLRNTS